MTRSKMRLTVLALSSLLCFSGGLALVGTPVQAVPIAAADHHAGDHDHDIGEMIDPYAPAATRTKGARLATAARTVSVSPASGPDFEMPFRCGEAWVGGTRSSHSPSSWSIDFNRTGDVGRPVLASAPGVVTRVATASGYGNYVIVDHGAGFTTLYAHMQSSAVAVGQALDQSGVVGYVGSSGRVTGPHLHFEMRLNGDYFAPYFHRKRFVFDRTATSTNCPDSPIAGDWNGDGVTDVGIVRPRAGLSTFYLRAPEGVQRFRYGRSADLPVIGDWDGDTRDQVGLRKPKSTNFWLRGQDGGSSKANLGGSPRDIGVAGNWTSNPKTGLGLHAFARRVTTERLPDLSRRTVSFGGSYQQPVTGDWNGDGVEDLGTFNVMSGVWRLRTEVNGTVSTVRIRYGQAWDRPVTGDWNGDNITDIAIWRPSNATFYKRVATAPNTTRQTVVTRKVGYGARRN